MPDDPIKNIAFYAFYKPVYALEPVRESLLARMIELEIKGTILLADEGINCSLSGAETNMDAYMQFLYETTGIKAPELKISYSETVPFKRSMVKIKPYIVAKPGDTPIDLTQDAAPYITPEEFHQWMSENKDMIILDTRNTYEYDLGRFKGSIHLGTQHFSKFEQDLDKFPVNQRDVPIVTFCTGGVRCEKAAPLMLKKGYRNVYQLEGGILNYFKKIGRGHYEGDCFVFDERRGIDAAFNAASPE